MGHRARRAVRAGRRRRGLPHGPQRPALPRRRHRPRGAGRPRVRGARRGPAAVRDDRCRRDPGHPVAPRRRGHQALQRVHAGDQPPQRRERRGRRAGAAGDLHAPVRDRRRAGPTGLGDVRVQQGQRCVRVRERRAAQPHPQGAARLRGLGDERLRRHAQHHAGDPRRPGPGDAGQHHPADRSGRLLLLRTAPRRRPRRAGAGLPDRRRGPADPAAHVRARALRQPARRLGAARGRARRVRATGRRAVGRAAQERLRRPSPCRRTSGRSPSSAPMPTRSSPEAAARWSSRPTR